jgi:hypothetical protein
MARYFEIEIVKSIVSIFVICLMIGSSAVTMFAPGVSGGEVGTAFENNSQVTADLTTVAPRGVLQGMDYVGMLNITFYNNGGSFDALMWMNVTLRNYTDMGGVTLWNETDGDGSFSSSGDTLMGSASIINYTQEMGYANFTGLNMGVVDTTYMYTYVVINVSSMAGIGDIINTSVNMSMMYAGRGIKSRLYPAYNTNVSIRPRIMSAKTTDPDGDGSVENATIEFDMAINDSTVDASLFKIGGVACSDFSTLSTSNDNIIEVELAAGISGTEAKDVTYTYSAGKCYNFDYIELGPVGTDDIDELDGAQPFITNAETADSDSNGKIDQIILTFTENVSVYSDFYKDLDIENYTVDASKSTQSAGNEVSVALVEGSDYDTNATPEVTFPSGLGSLLDSASPRPIDIASGDLNNDSYPDLVTLNGLTKTITVFYHDGNDGFKTTMSYYSNITHGNITVGDVTNDGFNDVVATDYDKGNVLVYTQNNVTNKLNAFVNYTVGNGTLGVAIGDVNEDDRNDVVVANFEDDQIAILYQNSTGGLDSLKKYDTGDGPTDVVIADIARTESWGSVLYDVVVTNFLDNSITQFRQKTDGTLTTLSTISTGEGPMGIDAGDLNNDGWMDIATANQKANSTTAIYQEVNSWTDTKLTNTGKTSYNVDLSPTDIAVIDANNDGKDDIITTNRGSDTVTFMIQTNSFSFGWKETLDNTPAGLAVEDFDLDGHFDAVTTQPTGNILTVLTQKAGDLIYNNERTIPLGSGFDPIGVDIGDVNNDGIKDLVIADNYAYRISVIYGLTGGGYRERVDYSTNDNAQYYIWDVEIGDLNNDGLNDVAATIVSDGYLAVYYQNRNGMLDDPIFKATGNSPRRLKIGDLNSDGLNDVVLPNYYGNSISVYYQDSSTNLLKDQATKTVGWNYPYSVAIGDVSGDGRNDVVTVTDYSSNTNGYSISRFTQKLDGTLNDYERFSYDGTTGETFFEVEIADMNGDGLNDIIAAQRDASNDFGIWYQDDFNSFGYATIYTTSNSYDYIYDIEVVDINKDNKKDILLASNNDDVVAIFLQTDTGPQYWGTINVGSAPYGMAVDDINGDGSMDIVTVNIFDDSITIVTQQSDRFDFDREIRWTTFYDPYELATGDLNNDGLLDVAYITSNSPYYLTVLYQGSSYFTTQKWWTLNVQPLCVAVGDINNDKRDDIIVGVSGYLYVYTQKSDGTFNSLVKYDAENRFGNDENPDSIAIGDLDNDGLNDVAVSLVNDVLVYLQESSGTLDDPDLYQPGGSNDYDGIAVGDLNDDDLNDLVVVNDQNDYIHYMLQSSSGGLDSTTYTLTPGSGPQEIEIGDLNNDDLDDIVVSNQWSNTISIFTQKSAGGFNSKKDYGTNVEPWGLDVCDLNGDGLNDVVVANSDDNTISIITQNRNGGMNTRTDLDVPAFPYYTVAGDFNNDNVNDIAISNDGTSTLSVFYPKKELGTDSTLKHFPLGVNSLQQVSPSDITEQDGADPVFAIAITGNSPTGQSSVYDEILVRISEDVDESTLDLSDFKVYGSVIPVSNATEISPGTIQLNVTSLSSNATPTVSLEGELKDANGDIITQTSRVAVDGLRPRPVSAVTRDTDLNGQIDKYIITFDEDIYGTFDGTGFTVEEYGIDSANSTKSGSKEMTLGLWEKSSYDTGLMPNITYTPGDLSDSSGNLLANLTTIIEDDGAPPALAEVYVYQIVEFHPNLYAIGDSTLYYNNQPSGLNAWFQLRVEASDNGRLDRAEGEDAFNNISVKDTTNNTGGTSWEYELNYTVNQDEEKSPPTINVTVYDLDDNNATDSISVILDKTPPETTMYTELGNDYVAKFTPITLTATDMAGIYMTQYSVDSGPWQNYTGAFNLASYGSGQHYLSYNSTDMVNNSETTITQPVYVLEDYTPGLPAGTYTDQAILVCNLTVDSKIVLENVTLIINSTSWDRQWINVTSTGDFIVRNSTIISYSTDYRSRFIMNGTLVMYNVDVGELWVDPATDIGGLEIYKDTAEIEECRFFHATGPAIFINSTSPKIANTTIEDSGTGIMVHEGAPFIYKNIFKNVEVGIDLVDNTGEIAIDYNEFHNVDIGINGKNLFKTDNKMDISNNKFYNIDDFGIFLNQSYAGTSQLTIDNNTFENIDGGIKVVNMDQQVVVIKDNTIKNITGSNGGIQSFENYITYIENNHLTNTFENAIWVSENTAEAYIRYNDVTGGDGVYTSHHVLIAEKSDGKVYIDWNVVKDTKNVTGILTYINEDSAEIYIRNNELRDGSGNGIWIYEYAGNIYVEDNTIEKCLRGMRVRHLEQDLSDTITIKRNSINNSIQTGIYCDAVNNINFENNYLYRSGSSGIFMWSNVWGNLNVEDNEMIENGRYGLYLADSSIDLETSLKFNTFMRNENGAGLYVDFDPGVWNLTSKLLFIENYPSFAGSQPAWVIKNGGNLSISGVTVSDFGSIKIESGGTIYAYDTIFSGPSGYKFEVFGNLFLYSCFVFNPKELYIENPGQIYLPATVIKGGTNNGVYLKNADITLTNIKAQSNKNGLYIEDCSPTIILSEFTQNANHGIHGKNFSGNITECELLWNGKDNLYLDSSGGMIYKNIFINATNNNINLLYSTTTIKMNFITLGKKYGIYLDHSDAHILLNHKSFTYQIRYQNLFWSFPTTGAMRIEFNRFDGIYLYKSNPHIENNTIWGSGKNGVSVISSGGHIEYNEIAWNVGSGIGKFDDQNPSIHDNYLHDNGDSPPNRAPSASGGTINPQYPVYTSTLSITPVGWYDPDGDPAGFIYQWQTNQSGTWTNVLGATASTIRLTTFSIVGGDEVRCRLTPFDGKTTGPMVYSDSKFINNSAPSITSVGISPTPAYDNSALTAVPTGFDDPDGDTSQMYYYAWYVNDVLKAGETAAFLTPGKFLANDTVYCIVTPSDGDLNGSAVKSMSVFVIHYVDPGKGVDDYDGDGVPDSQDAFPYDNTQWRDTDFDGLGDNQTGNNPDPDIDGDGYNNNVDAFDFDKNEWKDSDGDGIGDNADQDDDDDGYLDSQDAFPYDDTQWRDTDGDGMGDNQTGNNPDDDIDGDGVNNTNDAFDFDKTETKDFDSDGVGDNADQDDDDDGYIDSRDAFPYDKTQWRDTDDDGLGDNQSGNNPDPDIDGDSILNGPDVFPYDKDEWEDTDNDGIGNNKDPDDDGDLVYDYQDAFPLDKTQWKDTDGDGMGDNQSGNNPDPDIDGDGILNGPDVFPYDKDEWEDTDNDGIGNNKDPDDDNDGFYDTHDAFPLNASEHADNDKDGIGDNADDDDDNDKFLDDWEAALGTDNKSASSRPKDTDGDYKPDGDATNQSWMDDDDDGDGFKDWVEVDKGTDPLDPKSYPGAPNRPPSITKVSISPQPAYDNSVLTALPEGFSDPDGDTNQVYTYQWYNQSGIISGQTASFLQPANFKDGDTIYCWVTPSDGKNSGTAVKSVVVLIIHYTQPGKEPNDYDGDGWTDDQDAFPYDKDEWRDTDGDGTGDNTDDDIDGDGVLNADDAFPSDKTETKDSDSDGVGDNADQDDDNDGVLDSQDIFPFDKTQWRDMDGDGKGDNMTGNNPDDDIDGDGVANGEDAFPLDKTESKDRDGDGTGDNVDPDDDNDGVQDSMDAFPHDKTQWKDMDGDGKGDNLTGNNPDDDIDGDGVANGLDAFPYDKSETTDSDGDGIGDNTDNDDDNDGVSDLQDAFPDDDSEYRDTDGDGVGDNSDNDIDGDGVTNDQDDFDYDKGETKDTDGDGVGDNSDKDIDGDGVTNDQDDFPYNENEYRDTDGDGIGDKADIDIDGDGVENDKDDFPQDKGETKDTDGDGLGDNIDKDIDGDGVTNEQDDFPYDKNETKDTDGDEIGDNIDNDIDGDGVDNGEDDFDYNKDETRDTDGDKIGDNTDTDDDNDGVPDTQDAFPTDATETRDTDGDGVGDNSDNDKDNDGKDNAQDKFPLDPKEWADMDQDGVGDNSDWDIDGDEVANDKDDFPLDPTKSVDTQKGEAGAEKEAGEEGPDYGLIALIVVMVVVMLVMFMMYMKMNKQFSTKPEEQPETERRRGPPKGGKMESAESRAKKGEAGERPVRRGPKKGRE